MRYGERGGAGLKKGIWELVGKGMWGGAGRWGWWGVQGAMGVGGVEQRTCNNVSGSKIQNAKKLTNLQACARAVLCVLSQPINQPKSSKSTKRQQTTQKGKARCKKQSMQKQKQKE